MKNIENSLCIWEIRLDFYAPTCNSAGLEPRLCDAMWSHSEQQGSKFIKGIVETLCYEEGDSGRDSVAQGGLTFTVESVEFRDVMRCRLPMKEAPSMLRDHFSQTSTFDMFLPLSRRLCQEGHQFGVDLTEDTFPALWSTVIR